MRHLQSKRQAAPQVQLTRWAIGLLVLGCASGVWAQDKPVYRCPGPPILYTDSLTPSEARERGCKTIEGAPVTVVQSQRPRAAAGPGGQATQPGTGGAAASAGASSAKPGEARVDGAEQRARDADARTILAEELRQEEAKLAALQREFNGGEPERRGDERNYARYQERVEQLRASIGRTEANVAALRRELAKK